MSISAIEKTPAHTCELDSWHIEALILYDELECANSPVALPCSAPKILEGLAAARGIAPMRYSSQPSDNCENSARVLAGNQRYQFDGAFAALKLCRLAALGNLKSRCDMIPHFYLASDNYDTDFAYKTLVMRRFGIPAGDGVCAEFNTSGIAPAIGTASSDTPSRVRVLPKRHGGFHIIAESDTMEAAEEMLALSKKRIDEIIADAKV